MRSQTPSVLIVVLLSSLAGAARAQDASVRASAQPEPRHRVFVGAAPLWTQTDRLSSAGRGVSPGGMVEIGYDYALAPSSRLGLLAEAAVDFGSYGADADAITWGAVGARYTHLFHLDAVPRLTPFVGGGFSVGHTGGELPTTTAFAALMFDVGVEYVLFRHLSLAARVTDKPARMSLPGSSWHNAVGVAVDVAVPF